MEEEKWIGSIESYLSGNMNEEEKKLFEKEMADDVHLQQLYHQHKYFLDGIAGMKLEAFEKKMRMDWMHPDSSSRRMRTKKWWLPVAALILVLISAAYFLWRPAYTVRLAQEYYTRPFAQIPRAMIPPGDTLYQEGMVHFANKRFKEAIDAFSQVSQDHPQFERTAYYQGHSLAGMREYRAAFEIFTHRIFKDGPYVQQAEWYAALMLMFLNEEPDVISTHLLHIAGQPEHFYKEKATELLNKLPQPRQ
jgi:TolA-binding protein